MPSKKRKKKNFLQKYKIELIALGIILIITWILTNYLGVESAEVMENILYYTLFGVIAGIFMGSFLQFIKKL